MNIYELLEFNRIQEAIKNFTKTEVGGELSLSFSCFQTQDEATYALKELDEAYLLLVKYGVLPLSQSHNLAPIIASGKQGNILTPHDLYLISADIINLSKIIDYLNEKIDKNSLLAVKLRSVNNLTIIKEKIEKIVAPNLTIKNSASSELTRIRKAISSTEDKINKTSNNVLNKYSSYLAENLITKRDGHFVLPIKTNFKNKVDGIIYDISNSGQTLFVEPSELAELSNALINLNNDELIEINRLLRLLTQEVMASSHQIIANNILLGGIDFLFAKASYALKINGVLPMFRNEKGLNFIQARHPLIDPETVVSNTFNLMENKHLILISGPNAGGKTVALKTMGLFVIMAKSGLFLPCEGTPTLCFYNQVYASIGDEQSLVQNLSTFSSHVKRVGEILDEATANDLVLLDELATGTSPEEGEALALAITKYLVDHKISSVISSHYSRLKEFAFKNEGIINASMAFDEKNLKPLYKYNENVPGRSYGLVVAKRFGISEDIINTASSYLTAGVYEFEETIGKLRYELTLTQDLRDELQIAERNLASKQKELDKLIDKAKADNAKFNAEVEEALKDEIATKKDFLSKLIKEALDTNASAHQLIETKKTLDELLEGQSEDEETTDFNVGDTVSIISLNTTGIVSSVKKDSYIVTLRSGKTMKVDNTNLGKSEENFVRKAQPVVITDNKLATSGVKPEINVIGLRVDEALDLIRPYLDSALLKRFPTVRIIHGFGTGALRRAIHAYLATLPYVKTFSLAGQFDGQGGATVVTFK